MSTSWLEELTTGESVCVVAVTHSDEVSVKNAEWYNIPGTTMRSNGRYFVSLVSGCGHYYRLPIEHCG